MFFAELGAAGAEQSIKPLDLYSAFGELNEAEKQLEERIETEEQQGVIDQLTNQYEDAAADLKKWINDQAKALDTENPSPEALESYKKQKEDKKAELAKLLDLYADIQKNGWCSLDPSPESLRNGLKKLEKLEKKAEKAIEKAQGKSDTNDLEKKYNDAARKIQDWIIEFEPKLRIEKISADDTSEGKDFVGTSQVLAEKKQELEDALQLFKDIQLQRVTNGRIPFKPDTNLQPQILKKRLDDLSRLATSKAKLVRPAVASLDQMKKDYESKAANLFDWVSRNVNDYNSRLKGLDSHPLDKQWVQSELSDFRQYIKGEKAQNQADLFLLAADLAAIQKEQEVNGLGRYIAPKEIANQETLHKLFAELKSLEDRWEAGLLVKLEASVAKAESRITDEQLANYKQSFEAFDSDGTGILEKKEFKSCCQSMGIVFTEEKQFEELFSRLSSNVGQSEAGITLDSFLNWVMRTEGSRGSVEGVIAAFKFLSGTSDGEHVKLDQLKVYPLTDEDVEWLSRELPKNDDGTYNVNAWIASLN